MNDDLASFENCFPYYFLWPLSTYSLLPRHVDMLLHTETFSRFFLKKCSFLGWNPSPCRPMGLCLTKANLPNFFFEKIPSLGNYQDFYQVLYVVSRQKVGFLTVCSVRSHSGCSTNGNERNGNSATTSQAA